MSPELRNTHCILGLGSPSVAEDVKRKKTKPLYETASIMFRGNKGTPLEDKA
jgi:hypothetical protein